jgi:hypothetical protein
VTYASPFDWVPCPARLPLFVALATLTIVVMGVLIAWDRRLKKRGPGHKGIIDYELAGSLEGAQGILYDWGERGRLIAGLDLGLDYLYLVLYSLTISLGCVLVARGLYRRVPWLACAGTVLAWAQYGAALLDAAENFALIRLLLGSKRAFWPSLARWCAIPKFGVVLPGFAYTLIGGLFAIFGPR